MPEKKHNGTPHYLLFALISISALFLIPWIAGYGFADADSLAFYYPAFSFFHQAITAHTSTLWSPYLLSGFPLYGDLIGGFLHPLSTVVYGLTNGFLGGYHILFLINLLIAGACTYGLARAIGISGLGSWVAAITFTTSQWVLARATIPPVYFTLPVLSGLLLSLEYSYTKSKKWMLLGIYVLGTGLLAGHAQLVLLSLTAAMVWILFRLKTYRISILKAGIIFATICAAGLIIGAPYLIPAYHLKQLSERSIPLSLSLSQQEGLSVFDGIHLFFPSAELLFPWLSSSESFLFIGTLPLLLACLAICSKQKSPSLKLVIWGVALSFVASILYSPLNIALHYLPVFNWFRVPSRWLYITVGFLALLAGYGADNLQDRSASRKKIIQGTIFVIVALLIGSVVLSLFSDKIISFVKILYERAYIAGIVPIMTTHAWQVLAFFVHTLRNSISLFNPSILITILSWGAALWFLKKAPELSFEKNKRYLSALILIGSFISITTITKLAPRKIITEASPVVTFLKENMDPGYRTFSYLGKEALWEYEIRNKRTNTQETIEWYHATLAHNTGQFFGIPQVTGYSSVATNRQRLFASELGTTWMIPLNNQRTIRDNPEKYISERIQLLRMGSTQYIISPYEIIHPLVTEKFRTESNSLPVRIYEVSQPYPHVFPPEHIICVANEKEALEAILKTATSSYVGVIEMEECPWKTMDQPSAKINVSNTSINPGLISFTVKSEVPAWVIINESYLPGWHGYINGEETQIHLANLLFQKIWILPGTSEVVVRFKGINQ